MGYYQKITANPWLRLLSAENLKEALLKWRYNTQLQDYINDNIIELRGMTEAVTDTISYLESIKAEKLNLLDAEEQNLYALQSEYEKSNIILKQISSEETRIRSELTKQKNESERLNRVISDLIKKEEASAIATLSNNSENLTGGFVENRRNLPWPVNKGVVTEKFGIRQHPTLKNVKTENLGIDMLCPADTKVTSIYEGTVLIVTYQPPYDNIAIVNHGDFTTAYYYLSEVYVQKGAKIATGEVIGSLKKINTNADFHFEIWHNQRQVDPELWLLTKS
jgi:murein DD-endopeptidase MepM/ murein hydrolase activator NlpD